MDCVVTPLKTLMGFSVHLNVQLKFYNLPYLKSVKLSVQKDLKIDNLTLLVIGSKMNCCYKLY
ncbi:hypothetical protein EQJ03_15955 (plasmid) [Lactiplantibacillus plantarum]|nr:hypothetical protein EQJ03_15955 [Lactiplantibacillus plantarum]